MKNSKILIGLCSGLILFGCQNLDETNDLGQQKLADEIVYSDLKVPTMKVNVKSENARIAGEELEVKLMKAEFITAPGSEQMGRTVIFDNKGSKQMNFHFNPDRKIFGTSDMSYYIDEARSSSTISTSDATGALENAARTWEEVSCSEMGMYRTPIEADPYGIVAFLFGFPSIPDVVADVSNLGFMPAEFFDLLAPGGSNFILAVTFTFSYGGEPDLNGDGKIDSALKEIYYNDNFPWAADGGQIDLETVALHEMGHGFDQAHFGTGFIKKNGEFQFSPRAVMNASYSGIQHEIYRTDNAGHCGIWATWPSK
ncbi:hypothetical protein JYB62_04295 [Algoriphagus lutimaris]|uniref:hypothetical protein n=1 Tax=Algoriphagus lutimaris TaxID=613197 RepID=UPI00196A8425|nr:hypothetical protein [Algoriphagus lutimaris]MBN3519213.1 hypothetical protein [Algoriphagus lutimaris]